MVLDHPFSQFVRQVRERLAYSQEQLASELGVTFASVNRWENGHTKPSKLALMQFKAICAKHSIDIPHAPWNS